MDEPRDDHNVANAHLRLSEEQLRLAELSTGIGAFEFDIESGCWLTTPQVAVLFGFDPPHPNPSLADWEAVLFPDDRLKLRAAIDTARQTGTFTTEIRVRHPDGSLHWLAGKGQTVADKSGSPRWLRGAWHNITERKALEARLLAANEMLEARVAEVREEARALEILNRTGIAVAAELDLERLAQIVTDAGVEITEARYGAFFNNADGDGDGSRSLCALSGVPREAFADFPMPRDTAVFGPTFRGSATVRSNDILADPRYGQTPPYHGMPSGHLPVRSYLGVPIISRSGEVLGALFFGHPDPGIFTARAERVVVGLAAQAAVAIDNARLHQKSQQEVEARTRTEQQLQALNLTLEERVKERTHQLEASFNQLQESERRFRLLVESVTDYAIFMLDPVGNVIKWNPGAERLKGYTAAEIIGQHFSRFYTSEDRARGLPHSIIAEATRSGKYEGEGWRVRKDGSRFWANVVIHAIWDEYDQLLGFAKVTRDLTARREAEERLRQSQKMEAIGQLTGGVAHDFNNLLTVISGSLETLQRRLPPSGAETLHRLATAASQAASRAAVLTHQLLAFSRRQPLQPAPVSINTLISGMSEMLRRTIPENIVIETVLGGGLWMVFVDANQLENSLLNLVVNARDAMPTGGKLTIEAANVYLDEEYGARAEVNAGQYVGLFVSDTGSGMTPDVASRAFDPFFTTKEVGQGTGLGLSQVYGFVKQSGGHVTIYSERGAGTTIKLYLPRLISSEIVADHHRPAEPTPHGTGETILVVEDEPDVRRFSVEILEELGYRVLDVSTGAAGLRMIDAHPEINLLFTDVGLPGNMNGRQLAEEAFLRRPDLKVLFTSGYARNAIVHHGRLDPGVELIVKPFTFAGLAAKIRHILDAP